MAPGFNGNLVSVICDGRTVTGTASAGQPLLLGINGAQFSPLAALAGDAILVRAEPSPQLLGTVVGKCEQSHRIAVECLEQSGKRMQLSLF